jgi:putative inorganic carbon (hco3(-)) transporter
MDFVLFIALNGILLLRPEEMFPAIGGLRLYLLTIMCCAFVSFPKIAANLSAEVLRHQPVSVCVLAYLPATFMSFVVREGRIADGFDYASEFAKVVLYYFLLLAVIDTPARFRAFCGWVVVYVMLLLGIAVGQYHDYFAFPNIEPVVQRDTDPATGEMRESFRLVSSGIFNDPNDLSLVLVFGMVLSVYGAAGSDSWLSKVVWLGPTLPSMLYAFRLTGSRGGMLAMAAAFAAYAYARLGARRTLPVLVVAVPALLAVVGGRSASIAGGGTAHERLMLWAFGLGDLFGMPVYLLTGLRPGYMTDEYGLVCHNSFVQAYVETGVLGGGLFLGAFWFAARETDSAAWEAEGEAGWAATTRPFVLAALAGYAGGCYSVTRNHVLTTYLILGLVAAYVNIVAPYRPPDQQVTTAWWQRLAVGSLIGLVVMKYMTQALGVMGV